MDEASSEFDFGATLSGSYLANDQQKVVTEIGSILKESDRVTLYKATDFTDEAWETLLEIFVSMKLKHCSNVPLSQKLLLGLKKILPSV